MVHLADPAPVIRPSALTRLRIAFLVRVLGFTADAIPPVTLFYSDQNASEYDARRKGRDIFVWEEEVVDRLLASYPAGSMVLDVPVGTGRFLPTYRRRGFVATGVDVSQDMLSEAENRHDDGDGSVTLVLASATDLPFPDEHFDALVSFRFLPGKLTLRRARRALREYARVTRGQALILLKIGDRKFPASWRDEYSCLATRPERELREILAAAGLEVEHIERAPSGPKAVFVCRPDTNRRPDRRALSG